MMSTPRQSLSLLVVLVGLLLLTPTSLAFSLPATFAPQQTPNLPASYQAPCKLSVLVFFSDYCGACRRAEPWLSALQARTQPQVTFHRIDVDNPSNDALLSRYNVRFTPSYVVFQADGKPILDMTRDLNHSLLESFLTSQANTLKNHPTLCKP